VGGTCRAKGEKRNVYRFLVRNLEWKSPLGRPRCMWVDNIKMDSCTYRMEWCGLDWSSIKCWETIEWLHNWWTLRVVLSSIDLFSYTFYRKKAITFH
jgi:hypothetical protein